MTDRYRLDPTQSHIAVQAFATGPLSFVGHNPTFAVDDFSGSMRFDNGEIARMELEVTVPANALELVNRVKASDRDEIEGRMRSDVLEIKAFPEVTFQADDVAIVAIDRPRYRLRIGGRLSLHGVSRSHWIDTELQVFVDGLRLRGESPLRLSDYQIQPVTALGGAISLKDHVQVSFDLVGLPEGS